MLGYVKEARHVRSRNSIKFIRPSKLRNCKPRRDRQRSCGVELLSAAVSIHDGGGFGRHIDLPFSIATVSAWRFNPVYRFRVLSSVAREKMPPSNECHLIGPVVGLCRLRIRLDLFPAGHGEPHSRFGSEVIR